MKKLLYFFVFVMFNFGFSAHSVSESETVACEVITSTTSNEIFGIDFSHYSGEIMWDKLSHKTRDISFVFMRATYGDDVDFSYCENVQEAICRGYLVGSYHYFRSNECGYAQADNYLNTISWDQQHLRPVLDIEELRAGVTPEELRCKLQDWLLTVENKLCVTPIIYSNLRFWKKYIRDYPEFDRYPLWIAAYSVRKRKKEVMQIADIYQFSDREHIIGIEKKVDGNLVHKEKFLSLLR